MPTAKRVLVLTSLAAGIRGNVHILETLKDNTLSHVPGGGEQLPGWVAVCTATSCSYSRGRPPHSFAPANHKCANTLTCAPCNLFAMPWQEIILKYAKLALVKQKPSGLENTCKNDFMTSQIKQGFSLNM